MESLGLQVLAEACKTCDDSCDNSSTDADDTNKENIVNQNTTPIIHDYQHDSSIFTLYCKARGTPLDHQEDRAVLQFIRGEEYNHGADLICSHIVCRQNGVKFRYCAFCKKAVAKRNFRKRHAHNDITMGIDADTQMMDCSENNPDENYSTYNNMYYRENVCSQPSVNRTQHDRKPLEILTFQNNNHYHNLPMPKLSNYSRGNHYTFQNSLSPINCAPPTSLANQAITESVPKEWIELYHQRPKQDCTSKDAREWISKVKHVAGIPSTLNLNDDSSAKMHHEDASAFVGSNTTALSPFGEMSSSSMRYYDQMFNEVKDEFKGLATPRLPTLSSSTNMAKYRQHAEALSLQVNTDLDGNSSCSARMLDSDGLLITPKSFLSSDQAKALLK